MRSIPVLATVLLCAGCQPYAGPTVSASDPPPACASQTVAVTVGGQPEQAVVEACPQADGGWRITQTTPGLPEQVYTVPPPTAFPYYFPSPADYAVADLFPYWDGSPWAFGIAPAIVVVQKAHHFHHGFSRGFGGRLATGSRHFAGAQAGRGR
jgi:hypothetical protein